MLQLHNLNTILDRLTETQLLYLGAMMERWRNIRILVRETGYISLQYREAWDFAWYAIPQAPGQAFVLGLSLNEMRERRYDVLARNRIHQNGIQIIDRTERR